MKLNTEYNNTSSIDPEIFLEKHGQLRITKQLTRSYTIFKLIPGLS